MNCSHKADVEKVLPRERTTSWFTASRQPKSSKSGRGIYPCSSVSAPRAGHRASSWPRSPQGLILRWTIVRFSERPSLTAATASSAVTRHRQNGFHFARSRNPGTRRFRHIREPPSGSKRPADRLVHQWLDHEHLGLLLSAKHSTGAGAKQQAELDAQMLICLVGQNQFCVNTAQHGALARFNAGCTVFGSWRAAPPNKPSNSSAELVIIGLLQPRSFLACEGRLLSGCVLRTGLGQHLAKLRLGLRRFSGRFLPLRHEPYVGMTERELNP